MREYSTGGGESPYDIRTFSYKPDKANKKGGQKYTPKYIHDQHKVGICTAISLTQNAHRVLGKKYSPDFQYLLQKKFIDGNWDEGSSALSSLKAAQKYGLLPEEEFPITEEDRKLPYYKYVKKLKNITDEEIERLLKKTDKPLKAYAKVPTDRDSMANAIDETEGGIIVRMLCGSTWWTPPIQPLRLPKGEITGHLTINTNYDGDSFRIANTWGTDWADKGTAYYMLSNNPVTEAWIPYWDKAPEHVEKEIEDRKKIIGQIMNYLQKIIELLPKLA